MTRILTDDLIFATAVVWSAPGYEAVSERPGLVLCFRPSRRFIIVGAFSLN